MALRGYSDLGTSLPGRTDPDSSDHATPQFGDAVQLLIDSLPAQVAVTTADWRLLNVNRAWASRSRDETGAPRLAIGQNFRNYWQWMRMSGTTDADYVLERLDRFAAGSGRQLQLTVRNGANGAYWHLSLSRFDLHGVRYTIVSCSDVTEVVRLRREKRSLNISLMQTQSRLVRVHEEERLRLARDLHDTAAQHLVGMNLVLARLKCTPTDVVSANVIDDLSGLLAQFHKDLRGLTYLLHPPQLEQHGLHGAIQLLCDGFATRSGLAVDTRIYGADLRHSSPAENAVYRVVQEALSNVHRHAAASRVRVRLSDRPDALCLAVSDDGKGLGEDPLSAGVSNGTPIGVGIAGMIARVAELGGILRIGSRKSGQGTMIVAHLPRDGGGRAFIPFSATCRATDDLPDPERSCA